ncbi:M12 family metallo-peptidase [Epilithonimonas sp. JDS]|uniref:zinc-dependent metalloprotease n=1 Tax=Epilithonimonas sp. JDS TaxID=2902797 RepID=UPI001E3D7DDD|nr:zinc-dependent metalloprotease [Epilithonimonas sp. JDS]MCD9853920.1 M12 family metallo-peptidase [Epilithonimonas sp. JDS]
MNKRLTTLLFLGGLSLMNAQWSKATPNVEVTRTSDNSVYYKLDINAIRGQLLAADKVGNAAGTVTVSMPTVDGKIERFAVSSFPVMDEALANQYQLGSYVGVGIDDPTKYVRFSVAPNDFQSMVISNGKYEFIEPATDNKAYYSVHGKTSKRGAFECTTKEDQASVDRLNELYKNGAADKSGNKKFHTLRLAMSVTGEYGAYFGSVAASLAQINATMTRVNGVFEQEFNLHLNVVNAPNLIFTNASTDPYSAASQMCKWNNELMNVLHGGTYGVTDADYDIGHLFGRSGGGGNAGCIGCIGSNDVSTTSYTASSGGCGYAYISPDNYKGSGITSPGTGAPQGDNFDIDYVAHEMGHQLGDSHTYSFYETYLNKEMEPGSGSTIMGYAGITGSTTDVQAHSDPYFHTASIDQVQANLASKTVDVETDITNNPPVVTAMSTTYTIPKGTAFVLTAAATDPDGDALTYCWEEIDPSKLANGVTVSNIGATASGASFRSWSPVATPTRYFPKLATVLSGVVKNTTDFEAASTVARTTNFRVTVRDNKAAGQAQTAFANQVIVVGSAAAFTVSTTSLSPGTNSTVTWVPSGTTAAPYNVANVKIDFTSDSGATWTTLAASVANSGTASVAVPAALAGKTGHIRVSAIGNVFYAVKAASVGTLAVSDVNNTKSIQIFPNPVKDVLNVSNVTLNSNYEIFSAAGQLVSKGNLGTGKVAVNKLAKGVYFLNVDDKGTVVKTKFVKE